MKKSYYFTIIIISIVICLSSCKSVKHLVNKEFSPLSTVDQQVNALNENLHYIDSLKPTLGIYINSEMLLEFLPGELKKKLEDIKDPSLIVHDFNPHISFQKQGLIVDANFSITLTEEKAKIEGDMIGTVAFSTAHDSLYLRSAFNSLKIQKVEFLERKPGIKKRAIAKLMTPILKHFIENINGKYLKDPSVIDMGWQQTLSIEPKEMFKGEHTEVSGSTVEVSRYLKQSSFLVNESGISILIELDDKMITEEYTLPIVTNNHNRSELNQKYKLYKEKYDLIWSDSFEPINDSIQIAAMISKVEIANIFNEALAEGITLKQKIDLPKSSFNSKLEVAKSNINCQKVRTSFSFRDFNGDSCSWSCDWWNIPCKTSKEACRVKRETERIAWQAARETARIAHQLENETKVTACNVWRELNNFANLGRFKGSISGSGNGKVSLSNFKFNDDLSELTFNSSGEIDLSIDTALRLRPQDLGFIFLCQSNYDRKVNSKASANFPNQESKLVIDIRKDNNDLKLRAQLTPLSYEADLFPSPLHVYLLDPVMKAQCPIFSGILIAGSATAVIGDFIDKVTLSDKDKLVLYGKTKGKYDTDPIEQTFKPIMFTINNGEQRQSDISWRDKSIQFSYTKKTERIHQELVQSESPQ